MSRLKSTLSILTALSIPVIIALLFVAMIAFIFLGASGFTSIFKGLEF